MNVQTDKIAKDFYKEPKRVAAIFVLSLFFISAAASAQVCESLFQSNKRFISYNPENTPDLIRFFKNEKNAKEFKNEVLRGGNLYSFLGDYMTALSNDIAVFISQSRDKKIKSRWEKSRKLILNTLRKLDLEITNKLKLKKISYPWVWIVTTKITTLKEMLDQTEGGKIIFNTKEIEEITKIFNLTEDTKVTSFYKKLIVAGYGMLMPSILDFITGARRNSPLVPELARLNFSDFLEAENSGINFAGVTLAPIKYDGTGLRYYIEFTSHDGNHSRKMEDDRLMAGSMWPKIHDMIYSQIKMLPAEDKKYTEFTYWFLLHEAYKRHVITNYIIGKSKTNFAFDTSTKQTILGRLESASDFGQDFSENEVNQEIFKIGNKNLREIMSEVRAQWDESK